MICDLSIVVRLVYIHVIIFSFFTHYYRITSEMDDNEGRDATEMTAFLANPAASGDGLKLQPKPKPQLLPPDQRFSMETSHMMPLSSFQKDNQQALSPEVCIIS